MKKGTSNFIDLDSMFEPESEKQPNIISESITPQPVQPTANIDIDAILREWSWRCDKGYPDINNLSDKIKLQEVLDEMGIDLPFIRLAESEINVVKPAVPETDETVFEDTKTVQAARKASSELDKLIQTIPTMNISEKWGDPKSIERKDFENKVRILLKGAGADPVNRLRVFINSVNGLTKRANTSNISDIFNRLVVLRTINTIVTGFSAPGAGFIFEALTAAIMGGQQETGKTEAGVLANADVTVNGKSYSMKLLSGKDADVKGSKNGLAAGIKQYGFVTYIIMLRPSTAGGKITFYSGVVDPENYPKFKQSQPSKEQFRISATKANLAKFFKDLEELGTLDADTNTIKNLVQTSLVDLQQQVQPVYEALKQFTINLHSYFGTDKENERKVAAENAKKSAKDIDIETQKAVK